MGIRIVTWNVNGIRNPFSYQPWKDNRTFDVSGVALNRVMLIECEAMFDTLAADIICIQECKIQRKDLTEDMVLVPGWDCFFSLPSNKKGYSGVAFYTRQAKCAPVKAEEGITGTLKPPGRNECYLDLPEEEAIGGYPSQQQLVDAGAWVKDFASNEADERLGPEIDSTTGELQATPEQIDSEGRTVILEFPAFVIIGVYCPANTSDSRTRFRLTFLRLFETRIRNLVALDKRVVALGDFNIMRSLRDVAGPAEMLRKQAMTPEDFMRMPARWMFNHLLVDGTIYENRDPKREGIMIDICRTFHQDRAGMYTHWDTKKNHRPANFGSRIDYVICSQNMKDWFEASDIQEGLLGSDHCPVYAVMKDQIEMDGNVIATLDVLNPLGMFLEGKRVVEHSTKHVLPLSGRLLPGFEKKRSIREMFSKSLSGSMSQPASTAGNQSCPISPSPTASTISSLSLSESKLFVDTEALAGSTLSKKRSIPSSPAKPAKRTKQGMAPPVANSGSKQKSLTGFFVPKTKPPAAAQESVDTTAFKNPEAPISHTTASSPPHSSSANTITTTDPDSEPFIDPFASKASWNALFARKLPKCEHGEDCKQLLSKKPGMNMNRYFWMCQRPMGPTGKKENGTEWRCGSFIWDSDWQNGNKTES